MIRFIGWMLWFGFVRFVADRAMAFNP